MEGRQGMDPSCSPGVAASRGRLSVLVVEEDRSVAHLVVAALKSQGYLVVGSVASLREARTVVDEKGPDLILLDHQMVPLEEFA